MNENQTNLMEQLLRLVSLLHRYQHYIRRDYARSGDPLRGQGRVLSLLKMKPEITQKELSFVLDMRNQSLGELLAKLERSGYVTRTPSEEDRRVMNVKLTEAGAEAANEMEKRQEDHNQLFDCLSEEEQANLGSYLNKLLAELERRMEDGEGVERGFGDFGDGRGHRGHGGHGDPRGHGGQGDPRGPRGHGDPRGFRGPGPGFGPWGRGRDGQHDRGGRGFERMQGRRSPFGGGRDEWLRYWQGGGR